MYSIEFTPISEEDINFIQSYIGEYSNVVLNKIFHTIANLSYFPHLWFERKDSLKEIIDSNFKFRIIYKIEEKKKIIYILSIFKNKSDWK